MTAEVREATPDDRLGVRRVLDAAMLEVREDLPERIDAGDVLVVSEGEDAPVLGALVLVPHERAEASIDGEHGAQVDAMGAMHVDAVAVWRARRGQGVGSALVRAATERHPRLTAEFDADVRPFYESLGFQIREAEDGRLRGRFGFESDD